MIRRDGPSFPAAAHRRSAYYTSPSGEHHLPLLRTEFSFVGHSVARTNNTAPLAPSSSLMIQRDGPTLPTTVHQCAPPYSPAFGQQPPALPSRSALLFRKLCQSAHLHRRAYSATLCDTMQHQHILPGSASALNTTPLSPLPGNHYSPPSNRIQLCSLALNTAPQTPPNLRPRLELPSLSSAFRPTPLADNLAKLRRLSDHCCDAVVTTQQILLSLGLRVEGPVIAFCYNWSRPSNMLGTRPWIATQIPPTSPEALVESTTTFWGSASPA
jgi:hypothetical protein